MNTSPHKGYIASGASGRRYSIARVPGVLVDIVRVPGVTAGGGAASREDVGKRDSSGAPEIGVRSCPSMPLSRLPRMVPLVPQPVAAQEEEGPELPPPKLLTDEQVKAYIQNGFIACVHHPPACSDALMALY